jgi:hypothetical protein
MTHFGREKPLRVARGPGGEENSTPCLSGRTSKPRWSNAPAIASRPRLVIGERADFQQRHRGRDAGSLLLDAIPQKGEHVLKLRAVGLIRIHEVLVRFQDHPRVFHIAALFRLQRRVAFLEAQ